MRLLAVLSLIFRCVSLRVFCLVFSRGKLRKAVKSCEKLRKVVISGVIDVSDKSYFKSWKLRSVVAISLFFSMISVTSVVSFHFRAHREQRKWTICGYVWPCSGSICGVSCQANVRCIAWRMGDYFGWRMFIKETADDDYFDYLMIDFISQWWWSLS